MAAHQPEVVIGGAGVVGASVAWHLAELGCREVLILERAPAAGAGSTARATGGFRAQFGSAIGVRLSLLARQKLRRFGEEVGSFTTRDAGMLSPARFAQGRLNPDSGWL